jgi:hypothetical protein
MLLQLLHVAAIAVGLAAAFVFGYAVARHELGPRPRRTKFLEKHHFYWGATLLAAPASWGWWAIPCWSLGAWWVADDAYQHLRQLQEWAYESPLKRWWIRRVGEWLRHGWWVPSWLRR